MKTQIIVGLTVLLMLAGCNSRYNPGNWGWFGGGGGSEPTLEPGRGYTDTSERRPLVARVLTMSVEPTHGGAIVTAVGLPPTQGYWAADLVPHFTTEAGRPTSKDGIMQLDFHIVPPPVQNYVVNQSSREITAAVFLSEQSLRLQEYDDQFLLAVECNRQYRTSDTGATCVHQ